MRRTLEQFLAVFNSLAPSQRITFAAIALLIPAGFLFFAWNGSSSTMIPLSYGKVFSNDELRNAEQALKDAGTVEVPQRGAANPRAGGRCRKIQRGPAAVRQSADALGRGTREKTRKHESFPHLGREPQADPRSAADQAPGADDLGQPGLRGCRRALVAGELRQVAVLPRRTDAGDRNRQAAGRPRPDDAPNPGAARRGDVRDSRSQESTDVTVYDQRKGESYTPESENDPLNGKQFALLREASQLYESKIKNALAHISPDIVVTVNVELDPIQESTTQTVKYDLKRSIEQQTTDQKKTETFRQQPVQAEPGLRSNQPRSLSNAASNMQNRSLTEENNSVTRSPGGESTYVKSLPAMPKVVTVSVLVPEDYYAKALEAQKSAPGQKGGGKTIEKIKDETEQAVKNIVAGAIPNPDPKAITVSSFVPVHEPPPTIVPSSWNTVTSLFSQWGGAVGLGLFADLGPLDVAVDDQLAIGLDRILPRGVDHRSRSLGLRLGRRREPRAGRGREKGTGRDRVRGRTDADSQRSRFGPDDGPRQS